MPDDPQVEPDLSFLSRFLHQGQFLEFRLKAEGADGLADRFFVSDLGDISDRITDPDLHVWFGVANRASSDAGGDEALGFSHFLYVDLDHTDAEGALAQIVREAELPLPTLMVNSGHGIHAYWKLDSPLDLSEEENVKLFRRAEKAISAAVGGDDRARDAARVLRVPGTWNPKDPRAFCHQVKRGQETYAVGLFDPKTGQDKLVWIWKHSKVHQLALGIAGWCYHKGISQEDAEAIISEVASEAHDPEIGDRLRCVRDAYEGGANGKEIAYKPHLESRMGQLVLEALQEIWGKRPEGGPLIPIVEGKQYVQPTTDGVDFLWRTKTKDSEIWTRAHVIPVPLRFTAAYDVEGTFAVRTSYRDRMGQIEDITNFDQLPRLLRGRGLVMRQRLLEDSLAALRHYHINNGIRIDVAHPGIGYYDDMGLFESSLEEAIPLTTPQEMMKAAVLEGQEALTKKSMEEYIEVLDFFEPKEVLPVMGLAAIAPFLFALKEKKAVSMIPSIFIVGPHGLGKTTLNAIFTSDFYHVLKITGKAIDTQFRLDDYLNSMTFPLHVEEGEDVDFKTHAPKLKAAAESAFLSSKGKPSREQDIYMARTTLFFDGNEFPIQDWNLMMRFIPIEMEENLREERHRRAPDFDRLMTRLSPVGVAFSEHLKEWINESARSSGITAWQLLTETIRKNKEAFEDLDYPDVRRSTLWAIIYTGLMLWEKVCKDLGVDFHVDRDDFKQTVVGVLEVVASEARPLLLGERFREWWIWYLAANTRTSRIQGVEFRETQGEGEYFVQNDEAWQISQAALHRFGNGQYKLKQIATALAEAYGETRKSYYHRNMFETMGDGRKVRVLKLPKVQAFTGQGIESFGRPKKPGKQDDFTSQVEQAQQIRQFMESHRGKLVNPEDVSEATGIPNAMGWMTRLANEGYLEAVQGLFRIAGSRGDGEEEPPEDKGPVSEIETAAQNFRRLDPRRPSSFIVQDLVEQFPEVDREDIEAIVGALFENKEEES